MQKTFKAILFDADGTLYDSTMLHLEAYQKVSQELYDFDFTEDLFFKECIAHYKKPTQILRECGVPCKDEDFYSKKRGYYYEIAKLKLQPTAGLIDFLESARENNIPCVIVSGASQNSLEDSLTILKIDNFFKFRISYEDAPNHQKPHPYTYQEAMRRLDITPENCLAFEDTKSGVESTKKAELFCVGIKNTTNTEEELKNSDLIVGSFGELNYQFSDGKLKLLTP